MGLQRGTGSGDAAEETASAEAAPAELIEAGPREAGAELLETGPRGWRLVGWYGLWVGVNLILGVIFAYPMLLVLTIGLHVRAELFDRPDSPFMPKEIEGGEADGAVAIGVTLLVVMLLVVIASNWPLIRRLRATSRTAKAGLLLATAALLVVPVTQLGFTG